MDGKFHIQQQNNLYSVWHPVGFLVAQIMMPDDRQYYQDSKALAQIGKVLADRYNLKWIIV